MSSSTARHVYYGEVSRPPDCAELLSPQPMQVLHPSEHHDMHHDGHQNVHHDVHEDVHEAVHQEDACVHSSDRIVQVHIPELPLSPQYFSQSPHKIPLFYSGEFRFTGPKQSKFVS